MKNFKPMSTLIPSVVVPDETGRGERSYDIFSRLMTDRIVILNEEVNNVSMGVLIAQILHLHMTAPGQPIHFYINSPGGSVYDGLALVDVMHYISSPVYTYGIGMQASFGSMLLSQGEPGHRYLLPNSTVMIHQVASGTKGKATDMEIAMNETLRLKEKLNRLLADSTNGKTSYEQMVQYCERDNFLTAEEAIEIGLADKIITSEADIEKEESEEDK